jgi:phage major head subunit gpT-like protein
MPDTIGRLTTRFATGGGPPSVDDAARTVEATISSGALVRRRDMFGNEFDEELVVSKDAVDLRSLIGGPVLLNHRYFDANSVIGRVENAWIERGAVMARLAFSAEEPGASAFRKVKEGTLSSVSVGYETDAVEEISRSGTVPLRRVTKWTIREVSVVALPADAAAKFRSQERLTDMDTSIEHRAPSAGSAPAEARSQTAPTARDPNADNKRLRRDNDIRQMVNIANRSGAALDGEALVASDMTKRQARAYIFERLAAASGPEIRGHISIVADHTDPKFRLGLFAEALAARHSPIAVSAPAQQYRGITLGEVAREVLTMRGEKIGYLSPGQLIERAIGQHSTSDFAALLVDAANKSLQHAYQAAPPGVKTIGRPTTATDFKTKHSIKLGEAPTLVQVNQGGEFQGGSMVDSQETYALNTYGRIIAISRRAIINDDLAGFSALAMKFGQAAAEFESQFIVNLLTQAAGVGPTMSDGVALFNAAHGNLAGAAAAINIAPLGAARAAMRLQKGLSGKPINAVPKYLVVPAALETVAQQYLTIVQAVQSANVNPFAGLLELVVDPRLDAASAIAWYLAADPAQIPTIEYAYLAGQTEGVFLETRVGFEVDGIEVKARLDFGAGLIDFRGLYRNPGL